LAGRTSGTSAIEAAARPEPASPQPATSGRIQPNARHARAKLDAASSAENAEVFRLRLCYHRPWTGSFNSSLRNRLRVR
jgi:hypothetical protein